MIQVILSLVTSFAAAAPALTRDQIEPYRCRLRDGQDLRDVLAHGRRIAADNLDDLGLEGEIEPVTGANLQMFDVLRLFAMASGLNLSLSPDVARRNLTLTYAGPATVRGFADKLWAEFKRLNFLVVDDGAYLRVWAPCR